MSDTRLKFFEKSWQSCWQAFGIEPEAGLLQQLLAAYAEPQRHYHTQQHLAECLSLFGADAEAPASALTTRPEEIRLALWFHDAVYDTATHDNELRSAAWAARALTKAGIPDAAVGRIARLIMATRHDASPIQPDERLIVDIDLAILGAPDTRFAEYGQQVRQEYAWVPDDTFRAARQSILKAFLTRSSLYHSRRFQERFEAAARLNLHRAIAQLQSVPTPDQDG